MLLLVLVLLCLQAKQLLTADADDIVFPTHLVDGVPCPLKGGMVGQCRIGSKCMKHSDRTNRCTFLGDEPVLCCDVLQKKCDSIGYIKNATSPIVDHLVGNTEQAELGEFPFMALVMYADKELRCGASLVSDRFLLTAAHCIAKLDPRFVKLGTIDADDSQATTIRIKRTIMHERYRPKFKQNDIALIELEKDINRSSEIRPICLHKNQDELSETDELTIIGWGIINEERDVSRFLLKGTIRPISNRNCSARFDLAPNKGAVQLTDDHLCALGDETAERITTDACQGDSGGPLVSTKNGKHYLTGIISTGGGCGSVHFAGVYVRVNKYLDWIIEKGAFDS